jgi:hypothetical protein
MRWWPFIKRDADLERELRSDLELEEEEQRERGVSSDDARYAALRAFGNPKLVLQLYFTQFLENGRRPGPKGHVNSPSFRGLKPPAPSGIFDLQL